MKVNDYVRTEAGDIGKIISEGIVDFLNKRHIYRNFNELKKDKDIIKSSPNIIDLIETEDYVNGYKVLEICEGNFESNNPHNVKALKLEFIEQNINPNIPFFKRYIFILNEDIKSIVTKERFKSMEYKVGE